MSKCMTCREMIPEGKDEHTCFDAYEQLTARLRELVEKYDAQGPAGEMDLVHELEALLREDEKD